MALSNFNKLSNVQFQKQMRPRAIEIYQHAFGPCRIDDLREKGDRAHILDKEFAIDSLLRFPSGQCITLQEKYRRGGVLTNPGFHRDGPEFTQEYKNAHGTKYETDGEFYHLAAQLYFYGWANQQETGFERWIMLDVLKYKIIVENAGGLNGIGILHYNERHGRASFYAIPITRLADAIIMGSHPDEH